MADTQSYLDAFVGNIKKAYVITQNLEKEVSSSQDILKKTKQMLDYQKVGDLNTNPQWSKEQIRILEVQYNPATLSVQAAAKGILVPYLQKALNEGAVNQMVRPPSVSLTVDLIFDDVALDDAFLLNPLSAKSAIKMVTGGNNLRHSVRHQTNAFIAALVKGANRYMCFRWADMCISGELKEVRASYTMFSTSGQPIRSVVRLSIVQNVATSGDADYWNNAFDTLFKPEKAGEDGSIEVVSKGVKENWGALINLG